MKEKIFVEDTYLTDQPLIWSGRGRGRKQIPDPDHKPKVAYLFCQRVLDTGRKKKFLVTLTSKRRGKRYVSALVRKWIEANHAQVLQGDV